MQIYTHYLSWILITYLKLNSQLLFQVFIIDSLFGKTENIYFWTCSNIWCISLKKSSAHYQISFTQLSKMITKYKTTFVQQPETVNWTYKYSSTNPNTNYHHLHNVKRGVIRQWLCKHQHSAYSKFSHHKILQLSNDKPAKQNFKNNETYFFYLHNTTIIVGVQSPRPPPMM